MKKRLVSLFLLVAAVLCVFSACGKDTPVPEGHLRIRGRDVETDWILKVDGKEISADEYRYFFMNIAYTYTIETEGEYPWTDEENDAVMGAALEYVILNKALFDLAESYGITIDDEDIAAIEEKMAETKVEYGGEEAFAEVLASNYITPGYYAELLRSTVIQEKLSLYLTGNGGMFDVSEDEMIDIINDEYICVRYLKLNFDEEGSTEKKDKIAEYASLIGNKDDLITYINIYSEDVTMKNNSNGLYLTLGDGDDTLFYAASELEVGEISPVIEGDMGYYIVLRQPVDVDYITENAESFIVSYQERKIGELLEAESADSVIEYNSKIYKKISVKTME